jgi:hypothetical protein
MSIKCRGQLKRVASVALLAGMISSCNALTNSEHVTRPVPQGPVKGSRPVPSEVQWGVAGAQLNCNC